MAQQETEPLSLEDAFPGYEDLRRQTLVDSLMGLLGFASFPSAISGSLARSGATKEMIKAAGKSIKSLRTKYDYGLTFDGLSIHPEDAKMLKMTPKYMFTPRKASPLNNSTFTAEAPTAEALEQALLRKLEQFGAKP